jgi:hypothetical protein
MATRGLVQVQEKQPKSHTVYKVCEEHGQTEFYYYSEHKISMCKKCTREKRKDRLQDPTKRENELAYAKKWQEENKTKIKAHYVLSQKIKKQEKKEKIDRFLAEHQKYVGYILKVYEIPMDNVLRKDIARLEEPKLKDFIDIVRKKKFSKLKAHFAWKRSSLLKYEYNVRDNYANAKQSLKDRIASESQEYAIEEANNVILDLDEKLPVNKTIGKKRVVKK